VNAQRTAAALDAVMAALSAEALTARLDAKRAVARDCRLLASDLAARADRLDQLAIVLRRARGRGRSA